MTKKRPKPKKSDPIVEANEMIERRLVTMAAVMQTPLRDLLSFLDLVAEEDLTDARITDAQYVMGMPTPVISHLVFPQFGGGPSFGKKLLDAWLVRKDEVAPSRPRTSEDELAECLEEIARAARRHLRDPAEPAWRDRLSTATADAFAVLYDAPRPRRAITVEELLASGLVVKVGTDPSEAAPAWYNLHLRLDEVEQTETITLSAEGQAAFAEAILDPPPMAPAMQRGFERRAELLGEGPSAIRKPDPLDGWLAGRPELDNKDIRKEQHEKRLSRMAPAAAADLVATKLAALGIRSELIEASSRQIRFRLDRRQIEVPLGNDVWAALPGLPAFVAGIPVRYDRLLGNPE